ncbi:unnamed protein product [Lactuca virosa]|uniref:Exocyst complex component Sec8 n=1 Tax=Lactuca virosa TaxID=75947 RepID=A0AAU9PAC1_9ASTR|nr:unnamed protein product [Lactuca virosa]
MKVRSVNCFMGNFNPFTPAAEISKFQMRPGSSPGGSKSLVDFINNHHTFQSDAHVTQPDSINKPFFMVVLFVDNRDGTYTGFYMAMNVGTYKICASFDGMSISPCPFEVATYNREYFPIAYGLDVSVWEDESIVFNALLQSYQLPKYKHQNGSLLAGTLLAVSPVSLVMAPMGVAQNATKELLDSILDAIVRIFDNHVVVGELLESKSSQKAPMNTPKSMVTEISGNPDSESSKDTGGYTIGFSMTVLQSECQQLICEILRATPEAASVDAAVQTARLANKAPSKEKGQKMALHSPFASLMLQYPAKKSIPANSSSFLTADRRNQGSECLIAKQS